MVNVPAIIAITYQSNENHRTVRNWYVNIHDN